MHINVDNPKREFLLTLSWPTQMKVFHFNVSSVISKTVGIPFSSYSFIPSGIVVGLETFMQLLNIPFV